MDPTVLTFLLIGAFALLLMLLSLIGGHAHIGHVEMGHLHIGHLHLGHAGAVDGGHAGGGEGGFQLTLPTIAGFIGAFGFGGAIASTLWPGHGIRSILLACVVGLVVGVPTAWAAGRLMDAAVNMPTDAAPESSDVLGALGVVTSAIPVGGLGVVRLEVAGQQVRYHARADAAMPSGTAVFVIEVPSPTSVVVEAVPRPH